MYGVFHFDACKEVTITGITYVLFLKRYQGLIFTTIAKVDETVNITATGIMANEGKNSRLTRLKDIPKGNITFRWENLV